MGKPNFTNVDEYISAQPENAQVALKLVRRTLRKALPKAEEVISYKIPAYQMHGEIVVYFAGWTSHYSLYPASGRMTAGLKAQLGSRKVRKATIRFSFSEPVPVKLIEGIAKFRLAEARRRKKLKSAVVKKR